MEEDPLLTPEPWWGRRTLRDYPVYHPRRMTSAWAPGLALLGIAAVAFPILLFVLSKV